MAESALRQLVPQSAEPFVRSYNPFNPAFRETIRATASDLLGGRAIGGTPSQRYRAQLADLLTGSVDFMPGVSDAVAVSDTVQAIRSGDYGTAAILGGATMLGMVPVIGDSASRAIRKGLDMSQAARMQRAREQRFNTANRFYVGTQADFEAFDPNFVGKFSSADTAGNISLTPSPSIASRYAEAAGDPISQYIPKQGVDINAWNAAKSNLAELEKNISALQSVNNFDMWSQEYRKVSDEIINARKKLSQMSNIVGSTKGANVIPVYVRGQIKQVDAYGKAHDPNWMIQQQNIARKEGFDGVQFMGLEDAPGFDPIHGIADTLKIFDPSNIRSVNAAFDPAKTGSANLMAGVGGAAVGLSALNQLVPRNEERRPD